MREDVQTIDGYLEQLKHHLAGADPAVIQDAVNDAQDHIENERAALAANATSEVTEADLVTRVVETYGTADEVAEAYRETEVKVAAALAPHPPRRDESSGNRLFGVLTDARAYGALFYLLLALPTGIFYFTWVVTGLSLSLGLSVLIIGLPFALAFLATVRALSLVEGRVVEALLGERMPRRADRTKPPGSWLERIKFWLTDVRSWTTLFFLLLRLPLGIISFVLFTTLLSLTLGFLAGPILSRVFDFPITIGSLEYYPPLWTIPFWWMISAATALITLHLAGLVGRIYGSLAKVMLVRL